MDKKITIWFPSILYLLLIAIAGYMIYAYFEPAPSASVIAGSLSDFNKEALKVSLEQSKNMQSMGLLIIGAIGAILLKKENLEITNYYSLGLVALSLVCSVISIYFGYIFNLKIVEMLAYDFFDLTLDLVQQPRVWQLYFFMVSLVIIGLFFVHQYTEILTSNKR